MFCDWLFLPVILSSLFDFFEYNFFVYRVILWYELLIIPALVCCDREDFSFRCCNWLIHWMIYDIIIIQFETLLYFPITTVTKLLIPNMDHHFSNSDGNAELSKFNNDNFKLCCSNNCNCIQNNHLMYDESQSASGSKKEFCSIEQKNLVQGSLWL